MILILKSAQEIKVLKKKEQYKKEQYNVATHLKNYVNKKVVLMSLGALGNIGCPPCCRAFAI